MTGGEPNPVVRPRVRWFHFIILFVLVLIGGSMRWYRIDRESLALDEYWALYLATGRGDQLFEIPHGVIVDPPPQVGFDGAPPWWHIWNGLSGVTHPPLFYAALRGCVDWFGSTDRAIRSMSAVFGLGAVVVFFDLMRRSSGPWSAIIAAGLMAFSQVQIDHSQLVRPYTMLMFFGLVLCDAIIAIDRLGPSALWLGMLTLATAAMALTHYFSAGAILAAGIYIVIRFRGRARAKAIAAIAIGLMIALVVWGPVFWKTRHLFSLYSDYATDPNSGLASVLHTVILIPMRLCLDSVDNGHWIAAILLAVFVFASPLFRRSKSPEMLLWWLWMAGTVGFVAITDILRHSTMLSMLRYVFLASPAIYAVIATSLPGRLSHWVAWTTVVCAAVYGLARVQAGPDVAEDWKTMSRLIRHASGPNDVVAIVGYYKNEPAFDYFVVAHYGGDWRCPVMFVDRPPDEGARNALASRQRVWMVGHAAGFETARLMPGWRTGPGWGVGRRSAVWMLLPPRAAAGKN